MCAGEIVGVAGVAGNGQRELAETIIGMRPATRGQVRVRGTALRDGDPRDAIAPGVAYVPEDRLGTGVAPSLSVASNVVLKAYREPHVSRGPLLRLRRIRELATGLIERYDVADVRTATFPRGSFPAGTCRRSCSRASSPGDPRVLIAASPTRGLDVAAIETVHAYLRDAASQGVGVLLISEDLDEILALADRVAVMYEGASSASATRQLATVEEHRAADGRRQGAEADADRAPPGAAAVAHRRRAGRVDRVALVLYGGRAASHRPSSRSIAAPPFRRRVHRATAPSARRSSRRRRSRSRDSRAAVAFRMKLFNIGGEGQLYCGAIMRQLRPDCCWRARRPRS